MNIYYIEPFKQAYLKMKQDLFNPFNFSKWVVIGFCAWIANITGSGIPGGNFSFSKNQKFYNKEQAFDQILNIIQSAWAWLMESPIRIFLVISIMLLIVSFVFFITWLSSRGKFMFLYNIVQNKTEIKLPWTLFKDLGNSLFIWRIIFGFIFIILILSFSGLIFINLFYLLKHKEDLPIYPIISMFVIMFGFIITFIIMSYISLCLENFVVLIMYRYNILVLQAWRKFFQIFYLHIGSFLFYGVFLLLLLIGLSILILTFGCCSCCIGFILISLPYIGAVIMLPVSYVFRLFSVNFLAQFDSEYQLFEEKSQQKQELGMN